MSIISLQMIDHHISSFWWKELVKHFVHVGDSLEIRCWREEAAEIRQASLYGTPTEDNYEVSIKGAVSEELISELLLENPTDKSIYNKMTKYFTINVEREQRKFCSAHYGTEMYLMGVSDDDIAFFQNVMNKYTEEDFSIHIEK
ncbi:MAG: hypothetical protein J6V80_03545 [Clostridia bacterium]|nr:hypothetical protein [Clostridia bacterium]